MKRQRITAMTGAAAIVLLAAACSSSPTKTTGTETWQGTVTGAAAVASNTTTYPLKFTGPVTATATWSTPGGNATKVTTTFKTTAGNLVVNADVPNVNNPPTQTNAKTCFFKSTITGTYTVDGAKSTDKFKDATGHGTIKDIFQAYGPKLENGQCNQSNNAQPLANGALTTIYISGPLTVSS